MTGVAGVGDLVYLGTPGGRTGMEGRGQRKCICYSQLPQGTGLGGWELESASLDV